MHNAHMYYILVDQPAMRSDLLAHLDRQGVNAVSHYVPLHLSPGGRRFGRPSGSLEVTESVGDRLVRLPLFAAMGDHEVTAVIAAVTQWAGSIVA